LFTTLLADDVHQIAAGESEVVLLAELIQLLEVNAGHEEAPAKGFLRVNLGDVSLLAEYD
jgi:hypothetical protein